LGSIPGQLRDCKYKGGGMNTIILILIIAVMFYVILWQYYKLKAQDAKFEQIEQIENELKKEYWQ